MLEKRIEELTKAVEKLTIAILERDINELAKNLIAQQLPTIAQAVEQVTPEPTPTQAPEPIVTAISATDAQDLVLTKVREVDGAKAKIKTILASYKALKVADLDASVLAEFVEKVKAI